MNFSTKGLFCASIARWSLLIERFDCLTLSLQYLYSCGCSVCQYVWRCQERQLAVYVLKMSTLTNVSSFSYIDSLLLLFSWQLMYNMQWLERNILVCWTKKLAATTNTQWCYPKRQKDNPLIDTPILICADSTMILRNQEWLYVPMLAYKALCSSCHYRAPNVLVR